MAHEDLHRSLMGGGRKVYRRKRKFQGADWTPEKSTALTEDGVWCAACNQRHGYMSRLMGTKYEQRQGVWHILWVCRKSGNVIKDQGIVRNG